MNSIENKKKLNNYVDILTKDVNCQYEILKSVSDLYKDINSEGVTDTSRDILNAEFKIKMRNLVCKIQEHLKNIICKVPEIIENDIKTKDVYLIFNRNTRKEETFPCIWTKERIVNLYKGTGCSIEFLKKLDSDGNVLWKNENPDTSVPEECKDDDDSIAEFLDEDKYVISKDTVDNIVKDVESHEEWHKEEIKKVETYNKFFNGLKENLMNVVDFREALNISLFVSKCNKENIKNNYYLRRITREEIISSVESIDENGEHADMTENEKVNLYDKTLDIINGYIEDYNKGNSDSKTKKSRKNRKNGKKKNPKAS